MRRQYPQKRKLTAKEILALRVKKKYSAGGLAIQPMYGPNTIPGVKTTESVTYGESNPAFQKTQLENIKEANAELEAIPDQLNIKDQQRQQSLKSIEGSALSTAHLLSKVGTKAATATKAATSAFAPATTRVGAQSIASGSGMAGVSAAPGAGILQELGTGAGATTGTKAATTAAKSGLAGTGIALAGEGIKYLSNDDDATTANVGETVGSGMSGVGTGMTIGSFLGPGGTLIGGIAGGVYGLGKQLLLRNKARKEEDKLEREAERKKSRAESLAIAENKEQYSGYDFGGDIARYGGIKKYQKGGSAELEEYKAHKSYLEKVRNAYGKNDKDALVALGAGSFDNPYNSNDLAKDYHKAQKLRKAAGLGIMEEADLVFPHVGQQLRNSFNSELGTNFKYGGASKYGTGGVQPLQGGVAVPIPGSDAVEFKGNSHEEGGIMVDPGTEVEGDETMDTVTMKNGGQKDYFFSSHMKKGGMPFSELHKRLLQNGGTQKEIDQLAKVQETAAGRSPNKIQTARTGGVKRYQTGGPATTLYEHYTGLGQSLPSISDRRDLYIKAGLGTSYSGQDTENKALLKHLITPEKMTPKGTTDPVPFRPPVPTKPENTITEDQLGQGSAVGASIPDPLEFTGLNSQTDEKVQKILANATIKKEEEPKEPTEEPKKLTPEQLDLLRKANRKMPPIAIAGAAAQLAPPLFAMARNRKRIKDLEAGRDEGKVNAMKIRAPHLGRISYDKERAANTASRVGMNRSVDTAGMGAAGFAAKLAGYRAEQEGMEKLGAAEARANTQIQNQEAGMRFAASRANQQADLMAARHNSSRSSRYDLAKFNDNTVLAAVDAAAGRFAGGVGDYLSYAASNRYADAIGADGVSEREKYQYFLDMTPEEAALFHKETEGMSDEGKINWLKING